MVPFKSLGKVFYSRSIVTVRILYYFWDITRHWLMMQIFIPPWIWRPSRSGSSDITFGVEKLEWYGYLMVKKFWGYVQRFEQNTGMWWADIVRQHSQCYACTLHGKNDWPFALSTLKDQRSKLWPQKYENHSFLTQIVKFTSVNEQCVAIPRSYVCCTFWSSDFFVFFCILS